MALSITTKLIMEAAERRGWRVEMLRKGDNLFQLHTPTGETYYVRNISSYQGSGVTGYLTKNKDLFYELAEKQGFLIPATAVVADMDAARTFLNTHKKIVIKPADQSHGDGVTVSITTEDQLLAAYTLASSLSATVLAQEQIDGDDYRMLFIGGTFAAAVIREPAYVIGDGVHTIRALIQQENANPARGKGYENTMTHIDVDSAEVYLGDRMDSEVPAADVQTRVVGTANIGKGGVSIDVTDNLPEGMLPEAQRLVDHFRIGLAGVDYIVSAEGKPYLIEVNTMPSLGLHEYPYRGQPRNTPDAFLDSLTSTTL